MIYQPNKEKGKKITNITQFETELTNKSSRPRGEISNRISHLKMIVAKI